MYGHLLDEVKEHWECIPYFDSSKIVIAREDQFSKDFPDSCVVKIINHRETVKPRIVLFDNIPRRTVACIWSPQPYMDRSKLVHSCAFKIP